MSRSHSLAAVVAAASLLVGAAQAAAQIPLSPLRDSGQTITPAYEGWYPNPDGTITLSFGYYSRNMEETLDIPVGPENFLSPGPQDQGQPTSFYPLRHWGVFTVRVPGDFGDSKLTWTLSNRGQTFNIPGHLHPDWLLDAKVNPASGNTPPQLKLTQKGPAAAGPDGPSIGPIEAKVGTPLALTVWVTDDEVGRQSAFFRAQEPILLKWFKHQGPAEVDFGEAEPAVDKEADGKAETTALFSAPGRYILRIRANDLSGVSSGGHAQCCWTNGYVTVDVGEDTANVGE